MPSPALEPRQVIAILLDALHKHNLDSPRARFGCEVVLRFLAPSNPGSRISPDAFSLYLDQPWYQSLLEWNEYRWDGDVTMLRGGREAYQQVNVRSGPGARWASIRWVLVRVARDGDDDQWMLEAVIAEEPDVGRAQLLLEGEEKGIRVLGDPRAQPAELVMKVMKAIRHLDEPYPLHGCEVAIRYCAPTNRASRLSPEGFSQYLREPWYAILTEWDAIQLEEEAEPITRDGTVVQQEVLVRRASDESWTIVNWQLSRHSGRWLTDALTIT